jgi:FkbM family methyltransferase
MSEAAPGAQSIVPQKTATIVVQHGEREIPFRCFDNPVGKALVRAVMGGEIYRWPEDLPHPKVIVDIGANVGVTALWLTLNFPKAQVHCFEPSPLCHPLLEYNLRNVPSAVIEGYGLYDRDATLPLFRGRDDPSTSSLGQSVHTVEQNDSVQLRQAAQALHDLKLDRIDCLKIDAGGAEVAILESMVQLLPEIAVVFAGYHSEGDRRRLEVLMAHHHMLVGGRIDGRHRGHLTFARRASYADPKKRDEAMVRLPPRKGGVTLVGSATAPAPT